MPSEVRLPGVAGLALGLLPAGGAGSGGENPGGPSASSSAASSSPSSTCGRISLLRVVFGAASNFGAAGRFGA
eukprot:1400561-Alexandrium_andersonii.AAC.1